jgi:hypothetical protein
MRQDFPNIMVIIYQYLLIYAHHAFFDATLFAFPPLILIFFIFQNCFFSFVRIYFACVFVLFCSNLKNGLQNTRVPPVKLTKREKRELYKFRKKNRQVLNNIQQWLAEEENEQKSFFCMHKIWLKMCQKIYFTILEKISFWLMLKSDGNLKPFEESELKLLPILIRFEMIQILQNTPNLTPCDLLALVQHKLIDKINQLKDFEKEIELILHLILEKNRDIFVPEIVQIENREILFIKLDKPINVFVRNNVTQTLKTILVHPSEKASFLISWVKQIYGEDFKDLTTPVGKSLLLHKNLTLNELEIRQNTELNLKIENLNGGGALRQSSRIIAKKLKNLKQKKSENVKTETYETFPITAYGSKKNFHYLNETEWFSFQTLLFWEDCATKSLKCNVGLTKKFFFKDKMTINFEEKDLKNLKTKFQDGVISVSDFVLDNRNQNQSNFQKNTLDGVVHHLMTFFHKHQKDCDLIQFFDEIVEKLHEKKPAIMKKAGIPRGKFFNFSVTTFNSLVAIFDAENIGFEENVRKKRDLEHKALIFILFSNQNKISNKELKTFFHISDFLIKLAREHIKKFKKGEIKNFDKEFPKRRKFLELTDKLIIDFWEKETRECEGKKHGTKIISKTEKLEDPLRYIPGTIVEFYTQFVQDAEYGGKCKNSKNEFQVPKIGYFLKFRPHYVRTFSKTESGFCSDCLEMFEQMKVLQKILKNHCDCKSLTCKTFTHEDECSWDRQKNDVCRSCSCCVCDDCHSCKTSNFPLQISEMMKILSCVVYTRAGRPYPNWDCVKNKCQKCKLKTKEDLIKLFCPKALKKIKMDSKVTTKFFEDKIIGNKTIGKKKAKIFEVKKLVSKTLTIDQFLENLLKRLLGITAEGKKTKRKGFIWHWHTSHWQRYQYNQFVKNMMNQKYAKNVLFFVMDWAASYIIKDGTKLTSDQYFGCQKCQMLGIVKYSSVNQNFEGCANFFLSDQNVAKKPQNSVADLLKLVRLHKEKNNDVEVIHVFSDGSTAEFLNKKMFFGMKEIAKENKLTICWHFFGAKHGKNICDSEFGRVKKKLDRKVQETKFTENELRFKNADHICDFCENNLTSKFWPTEGTQVLERKFHLREKKDEAKDFIDGFSRVNETKEHRCLIWDKEGICYRKKGSCACENCVNDPMNQNCLEFATLAGNYVKYEKKTGQKRKKKTESKKKFDLRPKKRNKSAKPRKKKKKNSHNSKKEK